MSNLGNCWKDRRYRSKPRLAFFFLPWESLIEVLFTRGAGGKLQLEIWGVGCLGIWVIWMKRSIFYWALGHRGPVAGREGLENCRDFFPLSFSRWCGKLTQVNNIKGYLQSCSVIAYFFPFVGYWLEVGVVHFCKAKFVELIYIT